VFFSWYWIDLVLFMAITTLYILRLYLHGQSLTSRMSTTASFRCGRIHCTSSHLSPTQVLTSTTWMGLYFLCLFSEWLVRLKHFDMMLIYWFLIASGGRNRNIFFHRFSQFWEREGTASRLMHSECFSEKITISKCVQIFLKINILFFLRYFRQLKHLNFGSVVVVEW